MTPTSTVLSTDDVRARRRALLSRAGMSLHELRDRDARFGLSPKKQAILRRLEELEFLEGR